MTQEWIKLNDVPNEIPDIDVWLLRDDGEIVLSPKGDFVGFREYQYYIPIERPTTLPKDFKPYKI